MYTHTVVSYLDYLLLSKCKNAVWKLVLLPFYSPGPIPKLLVGTSLLLEDVKLGIDIFPV